jgi:thioredoxin-related protein
MRPIAFLLLTLVFAGDAFAVDFAATIDAAREKEAAAPEARRPMVVMFSSATCTWCRKMEVDTFPSDQVAAVADKFLWAKVDVEEHEELAARFNVRGLPHTVVLNGDDRVIAAQPGYLPPERFVEFLEAALANPQPIEDVLPSLLEKLTGATEAEARDAALTEIIERMALADREGRAEALESLTKLGALISPRLLALMADERLAVRAAAGSTLAQATKAELPFDPFAPAETRAEQLAAWEIWIKEHTPQAEIEETPDV